MRFVKLAILSFVILFVVITAISLFIPSHIRISKAVNLRGERDSIMALIKYPARWKSWYPGIDTAKLMYEEGAAKGVILDDRGSEPVYLAIHTIDTDEVTAQFVIPNMRPVVNGWKVISYPTNDSTTLQWYMDFHLRWYPWEKFRSLLLEGSYGAKMERGLSNFRKVVQSN